MPEQAVQEPVSRQSRGKRSYRGSVADLVREGLLKSGARIICEPRMGEQYTATVLASGDIQLPDGRTFGSLSAAGSAVSGRGAFSGWERWRTEDGRTLHELRSELQSSSDHQTHAAGAVQQQEPMDPVSSATETEAMPEQAVQEPVSRQSKGKRSYRGSVADLVREGLLKSGARIICEPRMGEQYTATVLASGDIQLPDGRTFGSLSAAGSAVSGRGAFSGWERWRTEDGRTLHELRSELQSSSDHQTHAAGAVQQQEPMDPVSSATETEAMPEQAVQEPVSRQSKGKRSYRGSVADLLREGLLTAGARIICEPRPGEQYTATVLASGDIQLPDGRTFNTPSAAQGALTGQTRLDGWNRWRTEDGRNLRELRSSLQFASGPPTKRTYRGSVADLLREGLLTAGARIICEPRPGEQYTATVLASGDIQLPDGRTFGSLSTAGQEVAGRKFSGWSEWRTEDGRTLHELRSKLRE